MCNLQSTREELLKQIHRAEIKLKAISTMIANLQARKEDIQEQIDKISHQFGQSRVDNVKQAQQMAELRKEMEGIDEKLKVRYKMLDDANDTISAAKTRLAEMKQEQVKMQEVMGKDKDIQATVMQRNILMAYNNMLANSVEPLLPTLSDRQQEILDNSGYKELTTNAYNIINCAMLLALEYVNAATIMQNLMADVALLVQVGDGTRMKMMNIGGGAALLNRLQ